MDPGLSPPARPLTTPPLVVLVDDDPAIRRLVALVLEDEPLRLLCCSSVAEARAALQDGPVQLLLTDLMMPGETGHDLLQHLRDQPGLHRPAHVVVFSAGLDAATQAGLSGQGVWRLLAKPVAVGELLSTVRQALSAPPEAPAVGWAAAAAPPSVPDQPAPAADAAPQGVHQPPDRAARQQQAMAEHFGGDASLFHAYRRSCAALFLDDLAQGRAALARGDVAALRRLGHSLKSVLRSLGETEAADAAQALDSAAQVAGGELPVGPPGGPQGDGALARAWAELDRQLVDVAAALQSCAET